MKDLRQLVYTIVPVFNQYDDTRRALASLLASTYASHRVCVVDNGSTDGTPARLPAEFPSVDYVRLEQNAGFAAAVNVGIRRAAAQGAAYVFLCNNDTTVDPAMLGALVAAMNEGVGAAAPVIYYMAEPEQVWFAGHLRDRLLLEVRPHPFARTGQLPPTPFQTDYIYGCGVLISLAALATCGGLDERYFFYYEDMDFCLRLAQAGYSLWIVPAGKMWHAVSRTAGRASPFGTYHKARSSVIFFYTHRWQTPRAGAGNDPAGAGCGRFLQGAVVAAFRLGSSLKKSAQFLLTGRYDLLRSHWRGLRDGWRARTLAPQTDVASRTSFSPSLLE